MAIDIVHRPSIHPESDQKSPSPTTSKKEVFSGESESDSGNDAENRSQNKTASYADTGLRIPPGYENEGNESQSRDVRTSSGHKNERTRQQAEYVGGSVVSQGYESNRNPSQSNKTNINMKRSRIRMRETQTEYESGNWYLYMLLFLAPIVVGLAYCALPNRTEDLSKSKSIEKSCDEFITIKKAHPEQDDDLWISLKVGVEGVLNKRPTVPSVFLFLHNNTSSTEELIQDIVKATSTCFDPKLRPVKFDTEYFSTDEMIHDYGIGIEDFKKRFKDGGVLLIANLNKIPTEVAKAFHFICDTENPVVNKVVIFFTLTVSVESGNPIAVAEKVLEDLWAPKLKSNELWPLITRVTDQVFWLRTK